MKTDIQVIIKAYNFSSIEYVKTGTTAAEILKNSRVSNKKEIIVAIVNNVYCDLSKVINHDSDIQYISINQISGLKFYRYTTVFILSYVIFKLYKKNILNIGPSIHFNFYFDLQLNDRINNKNLKKIEQEFSRIVASNLKIQTVYLTKQEAIRYYEKHHDHDKVKLMQYLNKDQIKFYKIGNYYDVCAGPIALNTGIIKKYKFCLYPPGFLIEFPQIKKSRSKILKTVNPKKLSKVFLETRNWYKIQNITNVAQLNDLIKHDKLSEIINISEALHEKKISLIADEITKRKKDIKFILIAGPSSSGKTSFVKRLSIQLKVNGLKPVSISIDNYFVSREQTPKDDKGNYDFECLEALDVDLFNEHLNDLLKEEKIEMPKFDFLKGSRKEKTIPLKLKEDQIILIEGIHGLNEKLTFAVPKNKKFKIYVSALSQLRISNNFRIPTRDTRLFRRIVRDFTYRDHTAHETLLMWKNVRRGEEKYVFPFQEDADIIFDSGLIYETSILKPLAYKYLKMVSHNVPEYAEARRLLDTLDYFLPASEKSVPKISLLREFIGGSTFTY
ncbi:MAG: nucleoside kinase [Spirochaetes bacterium]|nr:nucleoside kinase [Spirochaetota bacterium]